MRRTLLAAICPGQSKSTSQPEVKPAEAGRHRDSLSSLYSQGTHESQLPKASACVLRSIVFWAWELFSIRLGNILNSEFSLHKLIQETATGSHPKVPTLGSQGHWQATTGLDTDRAPISSPSLPHSQLDTCNHLRKQSCFFHLRYQKTPFTFARDFPLWCT